MNYHTTLVVVFALVLGIGFTSSAPTAEGAEIKPYVFGVFPHLPPRELEKVFAPMAADFSKALGREVHFMSSTSYENFTKNVEQKMFDIAFVQPFDYVDAADKYEYLPLATRSEMLKALIATTQDSPIRSVEDLRGKKVSMPPEEAAVSRLARVMLVKNGLVPGKDVTLEYMRSHMSCLQQVLIGSTAACGSAGPALRFFKSRMNVEMRIVAESDAIPHTLFVAHSRVPQADRQKVLERILGWSDTPEGKEILERGELSKFVPITNEAYDVVRKFPRN